MQDNMNQEPEQSQKAKAKKITVEDLKKIKGDQSSRAVEGEPREDIKWKLLEASI